jgi:Spy/CpxP family protein refolding chaperone
MLALLICSLAVCSLAWVAAEQSAQAQQCGPPPAGDMGGDHGPSPDGRQAAEPGGPHSPPPAGPGDGLQSTMRGGLQLGPPGRWWDDRQFGQEIGLSAPQKNRMDGIFKANRGTLLTLYRSLEQEESTLEKLTRKNHPDEQQIFQQIDQITKARGALEKANAHMLLEIRKQLTDQQIERLDEHRPTPPGSLPK